MGNDLTSLPPVTGPETDASLKTDAGREDAAHAVTALYREHALGLTRLAFLVLGDRHAAEDVVQDAFCGLYRAWDRLPAHDRAQIRATATGHLVATVARRLRTTTSPC